MHYHHNILSCIGNDDYDSGPYIVTFPSGVTNASFNVTIIDNDQYENTESFYLIINSFSLPNDMYISNPSQAIVIISDDDSEYNYVCITLRPKTIMASMSLCKTEMQSRLSIKSKNI